MLGKHNITEMLLPTEIYDDVRALLYDIEPAAKNLLADCALRRRCRRFGLSSKTGRSTPGGQSILFCRLAAAIPPPHRHSCLSLSKDATSSEAP